MDKNLYVFFGPPGAGKSTQSLLLQEKLKFQYISWGKISREIAQENPYNKNYLNTKKEKLGHLISINK